MTVAWRADSGLAVGHVVWTDPAGRERLTLIVKAAFTLPSDARSSEPQLATRTAEAAPLSARDLVPWKQRSDLIVVGDQHAGPRSTLFRMAVACGTNVVFVADRVVAPGHEAVETRSPSDTRRIDAETAPDLFQWAPEDMRCDYLRGGEVVLVHGVGPELCFRLPALFAHVLLNDREVPTVADTLVVDRSRRVAEVTWRGVLSRRRQPHGTADATLLPHAHVEETMGVPPVWRSGVVAPLPAAERHGVPSDHDGQLAVLGFTWMKAQDDALHTVVAKATYRIPEYGPLELAAGQSTMTADVPERGTERAHVRSLIYPTDIVPFKPRIEVLVRGHVHAKRNETVAVSRLTIGAIDKSLVAIGPRTWGKGGIPSEPGVFTPVPLTYSHAFGGPANDANPVGTGASGSRPPQLERPQQLMRRHDDQPDPICFAPIPADWPTRSRRLRSVTAEGVQRAWPALPDGFDMRFFQSAPEDQQCDHLHHSETFSITSVRPGGGALSGTLPGCAPALYVRRDEVVSRHDMRLDTMVIDADAETVTLIWRASVPTADEDASDIDETAVRYAPIGDAPSADDVLLQLMAARDRRFAATSHASPRSGPLWVTPARDTVALGPLVPAPPPGPPPSRELVERWLGSDDLAGRDLTGAEVAGLSFADHDLSGAILADTCLDGCDFRGAKMADVSLTRVRGKGVSFEATDLARADLTACELEASRFTSAKLTNASFSSARLTQVDFTDCDATGLVLERAELWSVDFSRATLDGADARRVRAQAVSFAEAKLDRSKWLEAAAADVDWSHAELERAIFSGARLDDVRFVGARGPRASWQGAVMREARLAGAHLPAANFIASDVSKASFEGAFLENARFDRAALHGTTLDGTALMNAQFRRASLQHATLDGANLYNADLRDADLTGVTFGSAQLGGTHLKRQR